MGSSKSTCLPVLHATSHICFHISMFAYFRFNLGWLLELCITFIIFGGLYFGFQLLSTCLLVLHVTSHIWYSDWFRISIWNSLLNFVEIWHFMDVLILDSSLLTCLQFFNLWYSSRSQGFHTFKFHFRLKKKQITFLIVNFFTLPNFSLWIKIFFSPITVLVYLL